jgi:hypothetical protein
LRCHAPPFETFFFFLSFPKCLTFAFFANPPPNHFPPEDTCPPSVRSTKKGSSNKGPPFRQQTNPPKERPPTGRGPPSHPTTPPQSKPTTPLAVSSFQLALTNLFVDSQLPIRPSSFSTTWSPSTPLSFETATFSLRLPYSRKTQP